MNTKAFYLFSILTAACSFIHLQTRLVPNTHGTGVKAGRKGVPNVVVAILPRCPIRYQGAHLQYIEMTLEAFHNSSAHLFKKKGRQNRHTLSGTCSPRHLGNFPY
ncbi:hypothetical protein F4775DRAFT_532533 [Biscogniauxia sp. FL1348]|nr:hypothetical protein F4775DRAFT_532533 [Biscogniauxia sp. FL1348]